jgi:uncharacterized protein YbjT (DUF2867 family)
MNKKKIVIQNDLRKKPRKPRMVVVGAGGYIGTNLVTELVSRGFPVRAVGRDVEALKARYWRGVELVVQFKRLSPPEVLISRCKLLLTAVPSVRFAPLAQADVLEPRTIEGALAGQDVAYYLVHCMRADEDFESTESQGAKNFAAAAAKAGVKRIIYLGGLIPSEADSKHLRSRRLTGEILRAGPVPVTELRAGIIVGPGCASFEIIRDLVNHLPVMVTPRWVQSKSPPIALSNVLTYLIGVAECKEAAGRIFDIAGPEMLSYRELMQQYGEAVGKSPIIIPVPVLTPRLSSWWLWLVTAVPTSIGRALIDGLKLNITADDREIRKLIPQRLLTYRDAVRDVFEVEKRHAVAARWTEGALMYRGYKSDYAFYAKRESGSYTSRATSKSLWDQVVTIGGENRYFGFNWLWSIRETVDWALGGPGRNRGRRHPHEVRVGDTIDYWRVIAADPPRRLTLAFGMKAPGAGVLEFEIMPVCQKQTRITVTAYWHPAGAAGLVYWHAFAPFHALIFSSMAREISNRAERAERMQRQTERKRSKEASSAPIT